MEYSVVVPLYNEEGNVELLHARICETLQKMGKSFEIIFIDDASTDSTVEKAKKLSPLSFIVFRKNAGQTAAMDAGIKAAQGKYIITLDGDLQNDPADIPGMVSYLEENGYDVVSGWRKNRKDPFMKRFISRGAYMLRQFLLKDGIHDSGCSLKIYKRECFETLDLYGEMHRFIPALLRMRGYSIGEYVVTHHPRVAGVSKYNWRRTIKGFLDMFSVWFWQKYLGRPLHFLGSLGIMFFVVGFLASSIALFQKFFLARDLSDTMLSPLAMFCFFFGIQFVLLGIIFDILSKMYFKVSKETPYNIRLNIKNKE